MGRILNFIRAVLLRARCWGNSLIGRALACHARRRGFDSLFPRFQTFLRPLSGMVDTTDSKFVIYRFKSDRGYGNFKRLNDGMVDVSDLGSEFWQFESAFGYIHFTNNRPLGEMVDTVALKATFETECQFESGSGYFAEGRL